MTLRSANLTFPVSDLETALRFYRDRIGFTIAHEETGFAVLRRDAVDLHRWVANDPNTPGAGPLSAGTAS